MGRAAVRARMKGRACQGLGRQGSCSPLVERSVERESKSEFLPKKNCNRQQTTTRTPAPPLIRNASAKRSRPGRGRPGVAPAGSVYGAVISGRFCVDQDLNIDLGPKSESGPGFDMDHTLSHAGVVISQTPQTSPSPPRAPRGSAGRGKRQAGPPYGRAAHSALSTAAAPLPAPQGSARAAAHGQGSRRAAARRPASRHARRPRVDAGCAS